jgi:hypothetical protein
MVNDYINNAPPGSDLAQDPQYQRYHSVFPRRKAGFDSALASQSYYGSEMNSTNPNFLSHPHSPTPNLYEYTPTTLAGDRRVSYASAQYPWIESAFRYTIESQNNAAAQDFDITRVVIPGRAGPGHYIGKFIRGKSVFRTQLYCPNSGLNELTIDTCARL